jgi:hypothetical protein
MRANHAIAALAATGMLIVGVLLYIQPESLSSESGLGLDASAEAPAQPKVIREAQMAPPEEVQTTAAAAERNPSSVRERVGSGFRRSLRRTIPVLETLLTIDAPTRSDGSRYRTQIVRTEFKYPLIRVETQISASGEAISTRQMVADHVLVKLQDGSSQKDLEDILSRQRAGSVYIRKAAHTPGLFLVAFDGTDVGAMDRVIRTLESETHVVARSEPDLIVRAF